MSHRLRWFTISKNGQEISLQERLVCAESFEEGTCSFEEDRAKCSF